MRHCEKKLLEIFLKIPLHKREKCMQFVTENNKVDIGHKFFYLHLYHNIKKFMEKEKLNER